MRKIWLILLGVTGIFLVPADRMVADTQTVLQISKDDRVLGNPDAPITIVEYASMTCSHCAHFANEVLPEIKKEWIDTGKAKLVLRDFPLDEPALRAAMVARCAPPDKFYPLADTFFSQQEQWVTARDYRAALEELAKLAGIGDKQFKTCIEEKKLE